MPPLIKICGVKQTDHVLAAARAGATAIGLNFIPPSSRYVGGIKEAATLIRESALPEMKWAGVFVNPDFDELKIVLASLDLQIIQLHGNETPEFVSRVKARAPNASVWKAFRVETKEDLNEIANFECDGVVLDAKIAGTFGGTGHTFDWSILNDFQRTVPLILSGGLNPGNVAEAIRITRPDWVDVASGVEISPGEKCKTKIADFIREAKSAGS
ncbi:MAG: phosphoribosylanthranilate isomerase [Planctomycetota bacterium]